jgi:dipeptidyl aminopeptidase/acylaminoacyl peptidase
VYFNKTRPEKLVLVQVPVLGGETKELVSEVDSTVSFSPEGNRFAFIRGDPTRAEGSLIVANSDGTGEQRIVTHHVDEFFFPIASGAAWSPDGERIAFGLRTTTGDRRRNLVTVDLVNPEETDHLDQVKRWAKHLADGRGLLITAN